MNEELSSLRAPGTGEHLSRQGDELVAPSGKRFPIVNGIPRFVETEAYAADFGSQWRMFPKTQLDSYTGQPISHDRLARCFAGELPAVKGKRVLEAGSGAGRFTEVLLNYGALLDSFDMSTAVEANAMNNGAKPFTLVQADIRAMPFEPNCYDYVVCLGVLQHTPNTEESIAKLWEMVRPGGRLVIDHYDWNRWRLPPPIGDVSKVYRRYFLRLAPEKRWPAVKRHVDRWFPYYWHFRDNRWAQRILGRVAGIAFYYRGLPLKTREEFYQWSLLDTHDAMTDVYKRYRTTRSIRRTLERLGGVDVIAIQGSKGIEGGNGIEATCVKPPFGTSLKPKMNENVRCHDSDFPPEAAKIASTEGQSDAKAGIGMTNVKPDIFEPHKIDWTPEYVRRFWDNYSSNPSLEDTYFAKSVGRHLIDYVSSRIRIGTAVDFGCGRGDLIGYLLARHDCYGVDQSPESVATVNQRFGDDPKFKGAFVDSLDIGKGSADTAFAVEVVEHLDDASLEGLLSGAHRVLKPGGHLVVTTPNEEDLRKSEVMCPNCGCAFHNMQHVRSWSAESLSAYLKEFGFHGTARRTMLSRRNGFGRFAHMTLHRTLRRPNGQLIYIGTAVPT